MFTRVWLWIKNKREKENFGCGLHLKIFFPPLQRKLWKKVPNLIFQEYLFFQPSNLRLSLLLYQECEPFSLCCSPPKGKFFYSHLETKILRDYMNDIHCSNWYLGIYKWFSCSNIEYLFFTKKRHLLIKIKVMNLNDDIIDNKSLILDYHIDQQMSNNDNKYSSKLL